MHRFLLHNEQIRDTSEVLLMPGQTGLLNGWGVFSTIRVFDGILFAYERHWARMNRDAGLLRVPMPAESQQLENLLMALVEANQARGAEKCTALAIIYTMQANHEAALAACDSGLAESHVAENSKQLFHLVRARSLFNLATGGHPLRITITHGIRSVGDTFSRIGENDSGGNLA